ncbi:MAG: phospholipid carrier-dependent glycosyltransferase [Planctomycetaceae bacterium]|nr:phospholipid carrier-dependent glycosyltransferase [Planctomycetaceae bacterium]
MPTLPPSSARPAAFLAVLLLTFVGGLLPFTADYVLFHPDERHYADAGIRMLQTGDYLTPRTADGRLRLKKPILPYWCVAAGYHAVGISPLGSRLGFLLAGAGVVGLSWWGASIAFGSRRAAGFAAVAAACQPALLISAPRSVPDVCLALAIQLSVCGFLLIERRQQTTFRALAAAFGGGALAVLCKGLPAVAFLGVAVLLSAWRSPALFRRDAWRWGLAAIACLLLGGSWFVLMGQWHSDELALQFLRDQIGRNRFAVTPAQALVQFPLCVALLLAMSGPWLVSALPELRLSGWRAEFAKQPGVLLILGWAVVYCALAGMINHVTPRYLLPVAAPLSIVVGGLLHQVDPELLQRRLWRVLAVAGGVAVIGVVATGLIVADGLVRGAAGAAAFAITAAIVLARRQQHADMLKSLSIAVAVHALLFVGGLGISSWPSASIGRQVRDAAHRGDQRSQRRIVFAGEKSQATQVRVALGGAIPVLPEAAIETLSRDDVLVLDESLAQSRDLSGYEITRVASGYSHLRASDVLQATLEGTLPQLLDEHERRFVIATPRSGTERVTHTAARVPSAEVR